MRNLLSSFAAIVASLLFAAMPALAGTGFSGVSQSSLTRTFTSSTTDTVPPWASGVYVTLQGGGSGGQSNGGASTWGGSSGMGWTSIYVPVTPSATLTITVGGGGAAQTIGGDTTVTGATYSLPTAKGGQYVTTVSSLAYPWLNGAGQVSQPAGTTIGTAMPSYLPPQNMNIGVTPITCALLDGSAMTASGGASPGGCSRFGKGGNGVTGTGAAATGFGAGGGGGTVAGGAGSGGLVILQYVQ